MDQINLNKGNGEYFGPEDDLPDDIQNKCVDEAKVELLKCGGFDKELNLEKDNEELREPGQEYALVSFMGPYKDLRAKHEKLQINIRGCCEEENIKTNIQQLQNETDKYDIYTLELNTWVAIPPSPEYMSSMAKHEAHLNKIISAHKLNIETSKKIFEARKKLLQQITEDTEDVEDISTDMLEKANEAINSINEDAPPKLDIQDISSDGIETVPFNYREKLAEKDGLLQGQNYAIISIVGDDNIGRALKVKGIYETEEEARIKMDILKEFDNTFECYIVECYRWLPACVDPNDIENKVYTNEEFGDQLNDLYNEHSKQQIKAKQLVAKNPPKASEILDTVENDVERIKE